MKEFYGKTFSAGSGTYGTRNAHTLRFLTDDGGLRAYGGGELVFAAEAVVSPLSINGTVGTTNLSKFVDDYIDDDLTVGDDIYNASTGTGVFDNSSHIVNTIAGDSTKYYCDDTADKVSTRFQEFETHISAIESCFTDRTIKVDGTADKSQISEALSQAIAEFVSAPKFE